MNKFRNKLDHMSIPVIQGGMGVGISMGNLAGAVAKEGGMGVISTANIGFLEPDFWKNSREANRRALKREIEKARELSQGNGLIAVNAMVATEEFLDLSAAASEWGIDAVISGAGLPLSLPEADAEKKTMLAPIVSSGRAAKVIVNRWKKQYGRKPDFFVIEGKDAGGHLGFSWEELQGEHEGHLQGIIQEVLDVADGIPVFVGGSIFDREDLHAVQGMGAVGAQIATRFIATPECDASQAYKDVILQAKKSDLRIIQSPVGMPGRAIYSPLIQRMEHGQGDAPKRCVNCIKTCNPKTTPYCINQALIAAFHGDWEHGLFFSGSNVERIQSMMSVHDLMAELQP